MSVREVHPDGPADKAGVEVGDTIERLDQTDTKHMVAFEKAMSRYKPGDKVELGVCRRSNQGQGLIGAGPIAACKDSNKKTFNIILGEGSP